MKALFARFSPLSCNPVLGGWVQGSGSPMVGVRFSGSAVQRHRI